jgi:Purine nucleobase transmembrane transport
VPVSALQCTTIQQCLIVQVNKSISACWTCNHFYRYILLGFLSAVNNLTFAWAWAYAYLLDSTASLLTASSLIFSTFFAYFIMKNKIYLCAINAIVVITIGNSHNSTNILGSAFFGLIFTLSELVFIKILDRRSFHVVLE